MLRLVFYFSTASGIALTPPDPDATGRFSVISPSGQASDFSLRVVMLHCCVRFCPVFVYMCNVTGAGGGSVIIFSPASPVLVISIRFNDKEKNSQTICKI